MILMSRAVAVRGTRPAERMKTQATAIKTVFFPGMTRSFAVVFHLETSTQ
jgi:hypothetical protein